METKTKQADEFFCCISDETISDVANEIVALMQTNKSVLINNTTKFLEPSCFEEEKLLKTELYKGLKDFAKYLGGKAKKNLLSVEDKKVVLSIYDRSNLSTGFKIVGLAPNVLFFSKEESPTIKKAAERAAKNGKQVDAVFF
jgi:hypothetical protein